MLDIALNHPLISSTLDLLRGTPVSWGPAGETVYRRSYSRLLPDGSSEDWALTCVRVAYGNIALVYGDDPAAWSDETRREFSLLADHIYTFKFLPAGRHLWATGVQGRQYLFNCHAAPHGPDRPLHRPVEFTFLRLMEGGGVGSNYSTIYTGGYGTPANLLRVHIVCSPSHPDYDALKDAGVLSESFAYGWDGAQIIPDSREGWAGALTDLIFTSYTKGVRHRDRVFDVTQVRHAGAPIKSSGGTASGPLPLTRMLIAVCDVLNRAHVQGFLSPLDCMDIDHAVAQCVQAGGSRRSARMAMLRWDDPWILDFIGCKSENGDHWTTNISVEIDNEFLDRLRQNPFGSTNERTLLAHEVHKRVMEGALKNGEPGYWNSDLSNEGEPNRVIVTNPCGEIALLPAENCNLGHINLDGFAPTKGDNNAWYYGELIVAVRLGQRFLIRATFGDVTDDEQAKVLAMNRRTGLGLTGVQSFLAKSGYRYSDIALNTNAPGYWSFRDLLRTLADASDTYAVEAAHELRIPVPVKKRTIAPTGSVSKLPGVSEGGHPVYARYFERRIRFSLIDPGERAAWEEAKAQGFDVEICGMDASGNTGIVVYPTKELLVEQVEDMGLPAELVESVDEIGLGAMLGFQALLQEYWADNAVSFTVNLAPAADPDMVPRIVANWLPRLKGTTIMVDASREQAPYTRITRDEYEAARVTTIEDGTDLDCSTGACPIR